MGGEVTGSMEKIIDTTTLRGLKRRIGPWQKKAGVIEEFRIWTQVWVAIHRNREKDPKQGERRACKEERTCCLQLGDASRTVRGGGRSHLLSTKRITGDGKERRKWVIPDQNPQRL